MYVHINMYAPPYVSDDDNKRDAGRVAQCLGLLSEYGADFEAIDAAGMNLHVY
jgi:hypothetical protein